MRRLLLALALVMTTFTVWAGDYRDGVAAYDKKDYATAVKKFTTAAEQGLAEAQFYLAIMYDTGQGVEQDYAQAVRWYKQAAEQGFANAQYNLGLMYANGEGVAQNYAEAIRWFKLVAAQGLTEASASGSLWSLANKLEASQGAAKAQFNLGIIYSIGQGVAKDYVEAARWYKTAAAQGLASAQYNLGVMLSNGLGVAQNYAEAVRWYKLAAEQGHEKAQFNLGHMYGNGEGVAQNFIQSHVWFNLAAAQGDKEAVDKRNSVAKLMTPQQIAQAQKLATECLARNYKGCD